MIRKGNARSIQNLKQVFTTMKVISNVTVITTESLNMCTQVQWVHDDVVLSMHGSHLVNQLFMPTNSHLIEINPYLYEQDFNSAGCASRHRHVLVGARNRLSKVSRNAENARKTIRWSARSAEIIVPIDELKLLLSRIQSNTTQEGRYVCDPERCKYL